MQHVNDLLGILDRPAAALTNAALDSDEIAILLWLVCILALVPQCDGNQCFMSTLPDELLLSGSPVGG